MSGTLLFLWLMPRNACVVILRLYRAFISPLYGDVCRYYPSCSAYALQAFQQRGVIRGVWLATRRLVRCHPWAEGGIDDVPVHQALRVSRFGFVLPSAVLTAAGATVPQAVVPDVFSAPPTSSRVSPPLAAPAAPILLNHGKA